MSFGQTWVPCQELADLSNLDETLSTRGHMARAVEGSGWDQVYPYPTFTYGGSWSACTSYTLTLFSRVGVERKEFSVFFFLTHHLHTVN